MRTPTCQPDDETLREVFKAFDLEEFRCRERVSGSTILDRIEVVHEASANGVIMYSKDMCNMLLGSNGETYAEAERKLLDVMSRGIRFYDTRRKRLVDVPSFGTIEELQMKLEIEGED